MRTLRLGRKDDARRAYLQAVTRAEAEVAVSPGDARVLARLAVHQAKAGDDAAARRTLAQAETLSAEDGQVQLRSGIIHALAGRTDHALAAIERAMKAGISPRAVQTEDDFERLRTLPRFAAMVSTQQR